MKLNQVINLKNWHQRNIDNVGYGTRDKIVLKRSKKGRVYFLAKTYDKDIGELRSEVCASNMGRLFGFPVQKTWLCKIPQYKSLKLRHPAGVLIQLDVRRQEDLLHGAEIISLVDKKFASLNLKEKRRVYTLRVVVDSIRNYVSNHPNSNKLWDQFFELLVFDALIGGTDRHYYNWGVLAKADTGEFIRLAPAFDNGISLMWKIEEYRPQFMNDLFMRDFPRGAESMFKKVNGGKYSLLEVLGELYRIGDYKKSNIVQEILDRIEKVKESKIRSVLLNNIPKRAQFKTKNDELSLICEYVKVRLDLLKQTLRELNQINI
ncbi:MAG: hypothetical protein A3G49_00305 [Candidatus Sungbacteria bacterium RIFCSPLOWO2_12_FULL_41_11]|uniref:HipA-like C-terminal domain-containing protein n=1 Tax=Candidatus Sungbacteria bacterium RIFCSPLOWO2_12_FULL_41_11 TaxID=1802286 RepID=A0A1G2LRM5_9BACT|nr:MAG: hypothetical protein UV01_C0011G0071 [Parcubacteria group bacterium GW2011_GWA2_42_14]OHA13519.1 MAG: hypothetical protein A3G49_00305 [Candidatus Sungbacteria bacterium RIFCSPLOWO2_12_FULL_41_11]